MLVLCFAYFVCPRSGKITLHESVKHQMLESLEGFKFSCFRIWDTFDQFFGIILMFSFVFSPKIILVATRWPETRTSQ